MLLLIPLWQNICVPLLSYYNIEISALKCIVMGGLSAALSFLCAGILQYQIESNPSSKNQLSILWQFPQFLFIMLGEVWLSIPGLKFSFTQAPPSMKSVMTAAWFCNNAFGNLIVVIVTESEVFQKQSLEYFFYALIMFIGMVLFCWIASTYQYNNYEHLNDVDLNSSKQRSNGSTYSTIQSQDDLDLIC